jgi:predicted MPP superfamily phosphohydrolase
MSVLLQISDTHFGTEQSAVVEAIGALAHQQRPDVVVLSGDITQRARPAQFHAARAFVGLLGATVLAVPGNHDIPLFDLWARLRSPYGRYSAAFGTDLEPVHHSPDLPNAQTCGSGASGGFVFGCFCGAVAMPSAKR